MARNDSKKQVVSIQKSWGPLSKIKDFPPWLFVGHLQKVLDFTQHLRETYYVLEKFNPGTMA